jgi:hypothetical protein
MKASQIVNWPSEKPNCQSPKKSIPEEDYDQVLFEEGVVTISQKMIQHEFTTGIQPKKKFMADVRKRASDSVTISLVDFSSPPITIKIKRPLLVDDPTKSQDHNSLPNNPSGLLFQAKKLEAQSPGKKEEKNETRKVSKDKKNQLIKMKTMNPSRGRSSFGLERQDSVCSNSRSILKKKMSINVEKSEFRKQVTFAEKKSIINYNPKGATVRSKHMRNASQASQEPPKH